MQEGVSSEEEFKDKVMSNIITFNIRKYTVELPTKIPL